MATYDFLGIDTIDYSKDNSTFILNTHKKVLSTYDNRLPYLEKYIESVKRTFVEKSLDFDNLSNEEVLKEITKQILDIKGIYSLNSPTSREEIICYAVEINSQIFSMGPLDELLKDDDVTDIIIHSYNNISVGRRSKVGLSKHNKYFSSEEQMKSILVNILSRYSGVQVSQETPIGDGVLANGERIVVVIPPVAPHGTVCIIRKQSSNIFTPNDLIKFRSFTEQANIFMKIAVQSELNIVIVGATGSGKTALVSALLNYIPVNEHLLTIEDTMELQIPKTHNIVTQYKTKINEDNPKTNITIYTLLKAALRSFPKYIIVGETRGAEAWEMLQAMKSGHAGITTIHAEDGPETLSRLEGMMALAENSMDVSYIRKDIAQVMDLFIIQRWIGNKEDGTLRRGIYAIYEVTPTKHKDQELLEDTFPNSTTLTREKTMKNNPKFVQVFGEATLRKLFYYNYQEDKLLPGVLPSDHLINKIKEKGLYEEYAKIMEINT